MSLFRLFERFVWLPLAVAVMLPLLSGCGLFEDDWKFIETKSVWLGQGIVNDTSMLTLRYEYDHFEADWQDKYETRTCHLTLNDIRTEEIYWKKEVVPKPTCCTSWPKFDIIDSIMFFFKGFGWGDTHHIAEIAVQMLGDEKFMKANKVELKYNEIKLIGKGWESESSITVRPWHNGLILANSKYSGKNNFALLDTVVGTMELWEPSGEFEWLNECVDAKWSLVGGLCLKETLDAFGFILLKNGVDTLAIRYNESGRKLSFYGNSIYLNGGIFITDRYGHVSDYPLSF